MSNKQADSTLCVHAGEERHGKSVSITTDIVQTAVFVMPEVEELRRYSQGRSSAFMYTRYSNPTTRVAEQKIAALEGAEACLVTASGQAATTALVLSTCRAGDEVLCMLDLYGGTFHLFQDVFCKFGVRTRFLAYHELDQIESCFSKQTRILFLETPTNPTLRCVNLEKLIETGRKHRTCVAVDNTFATPILQKPLDLGAHVAMHSATKYLGGHNDVTAGALAGAADWIEPAREAIKVSGGCADPFASYLLVRGLKTLDVRMQRSCENARQIADFLGRHARVGRVLYPGLSTNQGHEFARRQMRDFGAMVSFEHKNGGAGAEKFIDALQLWYLATSLGGVESTVSYPLLSSHVGLSEEQLKLLDVSAATVRLSVGIENPADLIADLQQALDRS